jgi:hypothetical protein
MPGAAKPKSLHLRSPLHALGGVVGEGVPQTKDNLALRLLSERFDGGRAG